MSVGNELRILKRRFGQVASEERLTTQGCFELFEMISKEATKVLKFIDNNGLELSERNIIEAFEYCRTPTLEELAARVEQEDAASTLIDKWPLIDIPDRFDSPFRFVLVVADRVEQLMRGAHPYQSVKGAGLLRQGMTEVLMGLVNWKYDSQIGTPSINDILTKSTAQNQSALELS